MVASLDLWTRQIHSTLMSLWAIQWHKILLAQPNLPLFRIVPHIKFDKIGMTSSATFPNVAPWEICVGRNSLNRPIAKWDLEQIFDVESSRAVPKLHKRVVSKIQINSLHSTTLVTTVCSQFTSLAAVQSGPRGPGHKLYNLCFVFTGHCSGYSVFWTV